MDSPTGTQLGQRVADRSIMKGADDRFLDNRQRDKEEEEKHRFAYDEMYQAAAATDLYPELQSVPNKYEFGQ